ncbi:hypothetical protein ACQP2Y_21685 [Actinoplanes sp. CA-051413]|uniref:hypothetical protein n=1 Tax=Actinoplanes sp. CA-051413 TaxID=3239899 RepID=UPI003D995E33
MTTERSFSDLRLYDKTCAALIADPDITGDLLLIGLWLARATVLNDPEPGEGRWSTKAIAAAVYGRRQSGTFLIREALRKDLPRYDPFNDNPGEAQCGAPMPRAPFCRRSVTISGFRTDPDTGRMVPFAVCGRKDHQQWWREQDREQRALLAELGDRVPKPPANTGGALQRHIRRIGWAKFYKLLDTRWEPPAEGASTRKPTLTVVTNDEFEPVEDAARPVLTVHEGGWR